MADGSSSKQDLREQMLEHRRGMDESEWETKSRAICRRLLDEVIAPRSTVLAFASKDREVNLLFLFESAPGETTFCLPRADTEERILDVFKLKSSEDLVRSLDSDQPVDTIVRGSYGIFEPDPDRNPRLDLRELDSVLVPGLVFDRAGNRIGYGGGYYDTLLPDLQETTETVGVCFDDQLVSDILPVDDHDQPVDRVVTDRRIQ